MAAPDPLHAMATGTLVVTPNNRLARALSARHDAAMLASGKTGWVAGRVLPWGAWLAQLWRRAADAGAAVPRLLAPIEARYLWRQIVGNDAELPASGIDARGVADVAADAWELVHAWGAGGASWRGWRDTAMAPPGSDAHAFVRWAEHYHRELTARDACDAATLADVLVDAGACTPHAGDAAVLLTGFLEYSPQQRRLCAALRAHGVDVLHAAPRTAHRETQRVIGATARDEIMLALQWARHRALQSPHATIGIAINGLGSRRDAVRALAEDVLCPALQLPGHVGAPRPYDLSLGAPLADAPVVTAALDWLGLAHGALDRASAAALFRSPHGPGRWSVRAGIEKSWIELGRSAIDRRDAVRALATVDAAAAARLDDAFTAIELAHPLTMSEWAASWRACLARCGWPGASPLVGAQHEAREALARVLDDLVRLDALGVRLAPRHAYALLRDHATTTVFQPQGRGGPVLVMGLLEAASLDFDALWVAGLSGQEWPPAPRPNPLLPMAWQREHGVPRSSAAREFAFAKQVTERLLGGAPVVVVSAPAVLANAEVRPTALVAGAWPVPIRATDDGAAHRIAQASTGAREVLTDEHLPPLALGRVSGGSGAIEAQADCPFMAAARFRMRADPWPVAPAGLAPHERGQLVHALMARFWGDVGDHAALVALTPAALAERLAAAAAEALRAFPRDRRDALPPAVIAAENLRLPRLASEWVEAIERPRAPFRVERIEARGRVELGGLVFGLTLDRVDALEGGGVAIVDYKTGAVASTKRWFSWRPHAPQLGLYLLALRAESPPPDVRAIAYARIKVGEVAVRGFVADRSQWAALSDAAASAAAGYGGCSGWHGIEAFYETRLPAIAAEFRDGIATVTPRRPDRPCARCARQSLCRIDAAFGYGSDEDEGTDA